VINLKDISELYANGYGNKRGSRINLWINEDVANCIKDKAERNEMSISDLIRAALVYFVLEEMIDNDKEVLLKKLQSIEIKDLKEVIAILDTDHNRNMKIKNVAEKNIKTIGEKREMLNNMLEEYRNYVKAG